MADINIKYDSETGEVKNIYYGPRPASWTTVDESEFPDVETGDDETVDYYYNEDTGEITAEVREINTPDEVHDS